MPIVKWLILLTAPILWARPGWGGSSAFEYPTTVLDVYDADESCWRGVDVEGTYPIRVIPQRWLTGAPPSEASAVTVPADHWLDLGFSGAITAGEGEDIVLVEVGKAGEQALLFVTDGADREYLLASVMVEPAMRQEISYIGVDLDGVVVPFEPRAIRLLALDRGGQSPGFDLGSIQARISHDPGPVARSPNPISGARGVEPEVQLNWVPSSSAHRYRVYLSDVASHVREGAAVAGYSPESGDVNTFDPSGLRLGETYYWRVDELAPDDGSLVREGDVWSFTVADHIPIDDFEVYADVSFARDAWLPGGQADLALELEVLDTCQQSIVFRYTCDRASHSLLARYFRTGQDWTRGGATSLQLLLHGDAPGPDRADLYVALTDGVHSQIVSHPIATDIGEGLRAQNDEPAEIARPAWRAWRIPLADLSAIDLTQIRGIILGVRPSASMEPGSSCGGTINIAEIGLYGTSCSDGRLRADLNVDYSVDYQDLQRMAEDWLGEPTRGCAVAMPRDPILWYEFEGNADDRMGRAHGQILGRCNFVQGVYGQAIHFTSQGDGVTFPQAAAAFAGVHDAITIAFWQKGDDSGHLNDTLFCSNYVYGQSNPAIAIHLGCWQNPGQYRWDCGFPWSFGNRVAGGHRDKSEWMGRWNHWAFTKDIHEDSDGAKGCMEIYLNGQLYDRLTGTDTPITGVTSLEIGTGWYGHYDGLLDDVQIYDYALSPAEIAYVATDGAGIFQRPIRPGDLDADEDVDLRDFAALAAEWLRDGTRP